MLSKALFIPMSVLALLGQITLAGANSALAKNEIPLPAKKVEETSPPKPPVVIPLPPLPAKPSEPSPSTKVQVPAKKTAIPEKSKMCQLYEGKYLAYYDTVFTVKNCKRYLLSTEEVYAFTRGKNKPLEEKNIAEIIQSIPSGGAWSDKEAQMKGENPCTAYDHLYVTDGVEIYWVEKCKLQQFPDWASYETHRGSLRKNPPVLRYLTTAQFDKFKLGKTLPSVITDEYRELEEPIKVVALKEACRNNIGKFVSYLDSIFWIEATKAGCQRREVDAEAFTNDMGRKKYFLQELTSSQILTIPVGSKYVLASKK
jgi:hypothetical protein